MKRYWLWMWVSPRRTVREIIEKNPSYGIYLLTTFLALENFFFYANMWSLGMDFAPYTLILLGLLISPILGWLWLFCMSHIFYMTGHWLQGKAPLEHLRVALAWSKIPAMGILFSWMGILLLSPEEAFIQYGGGNPYALIFHGLNLLFALWSILLVIRSIQEVEKFTWLRALANVTLAWALFSIPVTLLLFTTLFFLRY